MSAPGIPLDWSTAFDFTHILHRDPTSRLSTVPTDIVGLLEPYLLTSVDRMGCPMYLQAPHGTYKYRGPSSYGVLLYDRGYCTDGTIWRNDGSLLSFWGVDEKTGTFAKAYWGDGDRVFTGHEWNARPITISGDLLFVWERMTRAPDIP